MDTQTITINEEEALRKLLKQVKGPYIEIVTTGRGGLSIAQRLAYHLDLPVSIVKENELAFLGSESLFVDDIVCTGRTIGGIPRSVDIATLVYRQSARFKPTYTGLVYGGDEYIKFSWEKQQ